MKAKTEYQRYGQNAHPNRAPTPPTIDEPYDGAAPTAYPDNPVNQTVVAFTKKTYHDVFSATAVLQVLATQRGLRLKSRAYQTARAWYALGEPEDV